MASRHLYLGTSERGQSQGSSATDVRCASSTCQGDHIAPHWESLACRPAPEGAAAYASEAEAARDSPSRTWPGHTVRVRHKSGAR
jgi:hypothetical protein